MPLRRLLELNESKILSVMKELLGDRNQSLMTKMQQLLYGLIPRAPLLAFKTFNCLPRTNYTNVVNYAELRGSVAKGS